MIKIFFVNGLTVDLSPNEYEQVKGAIIAKEKIVTLSDSDVKCINLDTMTFIFDDGE